MDERALREEVAAFFERFVEAFKSFDGSRVAKLYFVPGVGLRGSGAIQAWTSETEVAEFFARALARYAARGVKTCRFTDLDVVPMGARAALGAVTWEMLTEAGSVAVTWRQSYNLVRADDGWKAWASTYYLD